MSSCKKDAIEEETISNYSSTGEIILGKKLENPYTIENMTKALEILKEEDPLASEIEIAVTDKYIRFLPKDELEYNNLIKDPNLILFTHPLLYEIKKEGTYYHDSDIPKDKITWQYAVVSKDYTFNNTHYEIISDICLPATLRKTLNTTFKNSLAKLEDIALKLVGIQDEQTGTANKTNSWYYPEATIRVRTSPTTTEPIRGVKVRVNHLLHTNWGITNSAGQVFIDDDFLYNVRYKVVWHTSDFKISYGQTLASKMIGPNQSSPWNCTITINQTNNPPDIDFKRAMAFMASYDFIHDASIRGDITNPILPNAVTNVIVDINTNPMLSLILDAYAAPMNALFGTNLPTFPGIAPNAGLAPFNVVWLGVDDPLFEDPVEMYALTIHELGHLSHYVGDPFGYKEYIHHYILHPNQRSKKAVIESWAFGVEWFICNKKYPGIYDDDDDLFPILDNNEVENYTQLVQDLIDDAEDENEGLSPAFLPDPDLYFIPFDPVIYKVENDIIYYTPNPQAQMQADMCPTFDSFLAPNGFCYLMDIPSTQPPTTYEIIPNAGLFLFNWDGVDPYDRVEGYRMRDIQTALYGTRDWHDWKDNLNNINPSHPTSEHLNELFNNWYPL